MRHYIGLLLVALISVAASAQENQKSVSVTIYNSNFGVIKDVREIDLSKGMNTVKIVDVASQLDPTSVLIKLPAHVVEQNYQYDLINFDKVLARYIDKEITVTLQDKSTVTGVLLSASGMQVTIRQKDGGLIMLPNIYDAQVRVPNLPEGLITRPTLVWTIYSEDAGKKTAELSYQASNMSWTAEYVAELNNDDTKMNLNSWVTVTNNSGGTYNDAQLKLIAGEVNRLQRAKTDLRSYAKHANDMLMEAAPDYGGFEEKEFFEYHLYDLGRKTTLNNNESKQIALFNANDINIDLKYKVATGSNYYQSEPQKKDVNIVAEFKNSKENNLGLPMPQGRIRVNKSDGKSLEFIGEDRIRHTPKDEIIKLNIGKAFDVVVEESFIEHKQVSDKVNEYEYEISARNRKSNKNIEIDFETLITYYNTNWEILKLDYKWEKKSANMIAYKVPIKAGEEKKFRLRIRTTSKDKK